MPWVELIPTLAGLVAVIVLPGGLALWLLRIRGPLAWAAGPAVTSGVFGVAAIAFDALGVRWSLASVAALVVLLWVGCAVLGRQLEIRGVRGLRRTSGDIWTWVGAAVGAAVVVGIVAHAMVEPGALRQGFDSFDAPFHLNAVRLIREQGNASSFDAMLPLHGSGIQTVFYPAVWHSMVAIVPFGASISAVANASTLVFLVIWCLGIAALTREVFPARPETALVAPVLAASFGVYPNPSFGTHAQWPWGAALAMVPGALALGWAAVAGSQEGERATRGRSVLMLAVALVAAGGAVIMHGSAIGTLALFAAPALVVAFFSAVSRARSRGPAAVRRIVVPSVVGAALVVAAGVTAWNRGAFAAVTGFVRAERMPARDALWYALRGFAPATMPRQMWPVLLMLALGAVAAFAVFAGQWLAFSLAATIVLFAAAAGPDGTPLRWLTGIWYTDSLRIAAFYPVAAAPLAALGFSVLARFLVAAVRRVGSPSVLRRHGTTPAQESANVVVAAVAVLGVAGALLHTSGARLVDIRTDFVATYSPPLEARLIDPSKQEMLGRLHGLLPPDAVLMGEPFTGAAYAFALSGVHVEFPNSGFTGLSADQVLLVQSFNQIHTNPEICAAVRRLGVTHYWYERAPWLPSLARAPGLFGVDVTTGFEEVASSDSAVIYRITACGE